MTTPARECEECGSGPLGDSRNRFCSKKCAAAFRSRARFSPEAFWDRVDRSTPDGCWIWTGSLTAAGYGHLRRPGGKYGYSHRVAYSMVRGEIPDGLVIDHLCRNRACANPDHLEAVPHRTNVRRGLAPYGLRTECKHGHDITDPRNVYTAPKGDSRCRICAGIQESRRSRKRVTSRRAGSITESRSPATTATVGR